MKSVGSGFFVTGTDTGVGKTWVTCGLITALRRKGLSVVGMKPIASGCERTSEGLCNDDALRLQEASSCAVPYDCINPYAFEPPIAPHIAARDAAVDIAFPLIRERVEWLARQAEYVVVEGVGGWRVPLGRDGDVASLANMLNFPVLLVVGVRLGCINHALLTSDAIHSSGLPLAGWVANRLDPDSARFEDNLETLTNAIPAPCLGVIPYLREETPGLLATYLMINALIPDRTLVIPNGY